MRNLTIPQFLLPIAIATIAGTLSLRAEVEVSNSQSNDVLSHYLTCRRPSDFSASLVPGFIRIDLGQTVRHLPIAQIETVDEQSFGVVLEWPTSQMKNGGGFMATTVYIPQEVMPPDAVFAILGVTNQFSGGLSILPEVKIGSETFRLPFPDNLHRLDGRFLELDLAVKRMASGAGNRVIALFGSAEDDDALRNDQFPPLKLTVSVQSVTTLEDTDIRLGEFDRMKTEITKMHGEPNAGVKALLERVETSTGDALSRLTEIKSAMKFGEIAVLGVFSNDQESICHSLIANTKGTIGDEEIEKVQATSVCVMQLGSKVVSIYVSAEYGSPEDLEWTKRTSIKFRDELRMANRMNK